MKTLSELLEQYQKQAEALAETVAEISGRIVVSRSPSIKIIQDCVCQMLGVPPVIMHDDGRQPYKVEARWIAYSISRELAAKSYEEIAANFRHGTDHGTVVNGIRKLKDRCSIDPKLAAKFAEIKAECQRRLDAHEMPLFNKPKTKAKK